MVDSSVLIDFLRQNTSAGATLRSARAEGKLASSTVVLAEVLAGMRPVEESRTMLLLDTVHWHEVDVAVADDAASLSRTWRASHSGIDLADYILAATTQRLNGSLLTTNVKHFPMFPDLKAPY